MGLDDHITHAYFEDKPVLLSSTPTRLFTASTGLIKVFDLKNSSSEPEVIHTVDDVKGFNVKYNDKTAYALVTGGFDCGWHDLSEFLVDGNVLDIPKMKPIWKSSSKILQAVFTHGGQRACIGDMAANMVIVDVSDPSDESNFGKVLEKVNVEGEITGMAYSNSLDLLAVTVADGNLYIYSVSSNTPEKKDSLGQLLVDKRLALTSEMGLIDDDSDLSDSDDDEDSLITESTSGGKKTRENKTKLLKYAAAKSVWNPIGDILAIPHKNFKIYLYNASNWNSPANILSAGPLNHKDYITSIAYSPNGKFLASTDLNKLLIIWDLKTFKMYGRVQIPFIGCDICWSDDKSLVVSSDKGCILIIDESTLKTYLHTNVIEEAPNDAKTTTNEEISNPFNTRVINENSEDSGDDVMVSNEEEENEESDLDKQNSQDLDGFIIDDDNNDSHRYVADIDSSHRRNHDEISESTDLTDFNKRARKNDMINGPSFRLDVKSGWGATLSKPFSVGSTPWNGSDRRYLTITPIGSVYIVKTQGFYKITVLFFDEEKHRAYFFDDSVGYDMCSINNDGAVFATSGYRKSKNFTARIEYKDHSNGRNSETLWIREISLRPYEFITSLCVHGNNVYIATNKGFVRKYNVYGRLLDITMMDCVVGIMNNDNYVFTVIKKSFGSGYFFNIQNITGEYIQQEVGIPLITENNMSKDLSEIPIKTLFFSSDGEPCIVRNDNLLLVLTKWRDPTNKPIWKPLLDIQEGVMRIGRGVELKAWPLGLFEDNFIFLPFRGSKNYPIFPLLTPMNVDIRIPIKYVNPDKNSRRKDKDEDLDEDLFGDNENNNSEYENDLNKEEPDEKFLRTLVLAEMLSDSISSNENTDSDALNRLQLLSVEYDKSLIVQIDDACSNGDTDDAFELCKMIRHLRGLDAAQKLAEVKGLAGLARRIRDLREARMNEDEEESAINTHEM